MFSYCTPCYGTENQRKSAKVWWQKFVSVNRLLVYKKGVSLSINKVDSFTEYFSKNAKITEITTQKKKAFHRVFFQVNYSWFFFGQPHRLFQMQENKKTKTNKGNLKKEVFSWCMIDAYDVWLTYVVLPVLKQKRTV